MITRVAIPDDAVAIADIHVRSWQSAYRGLLAQELLDSLDPARWTIGWRESLENATPPSSGAVVIIDDETIVGFAHVCPTRDDDALGKQVGEISSIYLRPDSWGRGAGRMLMHHALDLLRDAANTEATLWVLQGNERAIRFYEREGWRPDGGLKQAALRDQPVTEIRYRTAL